MAGRDVDTAAVLEIRRGETAAFRGIVERHGTIVRAVLLRLLGDREAAEELAHETFVSAYENLEGFRGEASLRTWLIQIAVNLARDRRRAASRAPRIVSLEELRERRAASADPREERCNLEPARGLERRDLATRLEREIARLPFEYREAFVLRHVEGLPYEQIAPITGDSVGCLRVRVHRARLLLRRALTDLAREDGDDGRRRVTVP